MNDQNKRMEAFIKKAKRLKLAKTIERNCLNELRYLREIFNSDGGFTNRVAKYRRRLKSEINAQTLPMFLKYFVVDRDTRDRYNKKVNLSMVLRQYNIINLPPKTIRGVLQTAKSLIEPTKLNRFGKRVNRSYTEIAIGLCLVTGRRPTEVLTGDFSFVNDNEVFFNGQLKTKRSENARTAYIIPVLCDARLVIKAVEALRKMTDFNADSYEDIERANVASNRMNSKARLYFRDIPNNIKVSYLRKLYTAICYEAFCKSTAYDKNAYMALLLGHTVGDTVTANSYKMYDCKGVKTSDIYGCDFNVNYTHLEDMEIIQNMIREAINDM